MPWVSTWVAIRLGLTFAAGDALWPQAEAQPRNAAGLPTGDRTARLAAIERSVGNPQAHTALRAALDAPDAQIRQSALRALIVNGDGEGVATATRWALGGATRERLAGLDGLRLARTLSAEALRALERALADSDQAVRAAALEALSGKDVARVLPRIAACLQEAAPAMKLRAVRLLTEARDVRAVLPLLELLSDPDREVAGQAMTALGRIGDARAIPALRRALAYGPNDLRAAALGALSDLRAISATTDIATLATQNPREPLARQAQRALGHIGGRDATAALVRLAAQTPTTQETREALRDGAPGARSDIAALVRLAEPGTAADLAPALGLMGGAEASEALLYRLGQRDEAYLPALVALATMRGRQATPAFVLATNDESQTIRRTALDALAASADQRGLDAALRGVQDADAGVRAAALRFISRANTAASDAVVGALADEDPTVQLAALQALVSLRPAGGAQALLNAARPLKQEAAAEALRLTAGPGDVPALLQQSHATGKARVAVFAGLASAFAQGRPSTRSDDDAAVELLQAEARADRITAELAADGLSARAARGEDLPNIALAFDQARPVVRARLCAAVARTSGGAERLRKLVADADEADQVRAAAAWALAFDASKASRATLAAAAAGPGHPALRANAQAALSSARYKPRLLLARVLDRPHEPRWVVIETSRGPVWTRTGALGQIAVAVPESDAVRLSLAQADETLEDAGHSLWQVTGDEQPRP